MVESDPGIPRASRRAVTRALGVTTLLAASAALSGCGVRLDEDAPDIPFIPRRAKVPGESVLVQLVAQTSTLTALAGAAAGADPIAGLLLDIHRTQATVLHDRLRAAGVPDSVLGPVPNPTFAEDATTGRLREAETAAVAQADLYAGVDPAFGTLVLAMLAQHHAAALALEPAGASGSSEASPAAAGAASTPSPPGSASTAPSPLPTPGIRDRTTLLPGAAITAIGEVLYLIDVILPHAGDAERALALGSRAALHALSERGLQELGSDKPPAVLGVPHPSDLDSATSQREAIAAALSRVVDAYGQSLGDLAKTRSREALRLVPTELGDLVDWHRRWGGALTPFPGLR